MARYLALLLTPLCLAAAPVQAASPEDHVSVVIPYGDDGVATADGLSDMRRRIGIAVDEFCMDPSGPSPAVTVNLVCRFDALRSAHAQLNDLVARQRTGLLVYADAR